MWSWRKAGSLSLACATVIAIFVVCWDSPAPVTSIHESSTGAAGDMTGSMYAQQAALYKTMVNEDYELLQSAQTADSMVPEHSGQANDSWKTERQIVWDADKAMLQKDDKAMYAVLRNELSDANSVQWRRYLRHKNVHSPTSEGHSWKIGNEEVVSGILMETSTSESESLCDHDVQQHHGYFKLQGGKDKNYFYWLFEAREDPENAPLIMWLTGGPGCSSELALFTENGPCKVTSGGETTVNNPFSWNGKANIVFLDQPAGTGFSYGGGQEDIDKSEATVSRDLWHFMQELVKKYPKYHKNDFYIFGESYAGHFVPAAGHAILKGNLAKDGEYIALKGIGVGNGLTDPETQYPYYAQFAFHSKTTPQVIDRDQYENMLKHTPGCLDKIKQCQTDNEACNEAFGICNEYLINPVQDTGLNVYNLNEQCAVPPLCGDYSDVTDYLNSPRVKKVLGVQKSWRTCNFGVNGLFHNDWMHSQAPHIPPMLHNGMRVMIYAGDVDFICNWMGNKAWTLKLPWDGHDAFNKAPDRDWEINGKKVGVERRADGLTFLRIHKAGHMVPQDQPEVAWAMVNSFIKGEVLVQDVPAEAAGTA